MSTFIQGFLDNDSFFGRTMNKAWIIIAANLTFLVFCIPVVTIGPAFTALYHVMLKTLRGDGQINPFKEFWIGFKSNIKQSILCWLAFAALLVVGYLDLRFCQQQGGMLDLFRYGIYAVGIIAILVFVYLQPVMAAFADTIPHLMRNAIYFICKKPLKTLVILFFNVFPLYLTYTDLQMLPLYAFCWFFFGFGAVAMIGSSLLVKEFAPYLDPKEQEEGADMDADEKAMLEDLRMMDGV